MRHYEALILFSPELSDENRQEVLGNLKGVIERENGSIILDDVWGMRELAYPVEKQTRGFYHRFEFAADGGTVAEFERNVRITDGIFKFITVKLADEYSAVEEA
jgi:small subunit ribosomal protein S6